MYVAIFKRKQVVNTNIERVVFCQKYIMILNSKVYGTVSYIYKLTWAAHRSYAAS